MNNPIKLISPVQSLAGLKIFVAANSICVALQISKHFLQKPEPVVTESGDLIGGMRYLSNIKARLQAVWVALHDK